MTKLTEKECVPCKDDFPAMTLPQARDLMEHVPGWTLSGDGTFISRCYNFPNFKKALAFTNKVGELAESEGHHPDIELSWGKVGITLLTHSVKGLTENDFIVASKINELQD
ncbi:MAG TPA: 4a-hydroxytetrahydrobiopterin dehydratase [Candidatus Paceibacterota bacterium]